MKPLSCDCKWTPSVDYIVNENANYRGTYAQIFRSFFIAMSLIKLPNVFILCNA